MSLDQVIAAPPEAVEQATADLFDRAAATRRAEYRPRHGAGAHAAASNVLQLRPASTTARVAGTEVLQPDRDLSENRPGEAARARALREVDPVRAFFDRTVGARTSERAWRVGAYGEEDVARRLAQLGDGWRVLHALPVGERGNDIDHLVIGPQGVFIINAKHHPDASVCVAGDTFKVNSFNRPYVRKSRLEADCAATLITAAAGFDVTVRSMLVVVGAQRGFKVKQQPSDVTVARRQDVVPFLRDAPVVLDEAAVDKIYDVARHLATWQPKTVAWQDFAVHV